MIVVMPDREWQWYVASTTPAVPADRTGHIGAEVEREPDAAPRRHIGFRMPEPPPQTPGLALPDWLLPSINGRQALHEGPRKAGPR